MYGHLLAYRETMEDRFGDGFGMAMATWIQSSLPEFLDFKKMGGDHISGEQTVYTFSGQYTLEVNKSSTKDP